MVQQKTIAIIHREKNLTDALVAMAQSLGYSPLAMLVDRTTTPQQVSSFVDRVAPDLVFLAENYQDYSGGREGEGIEALIEIRKSHPRDELPVYMVSGGIYTQPKEAMQAGANGYLPIPIG